MCTVSPDLVKFEFNRSECDGLHPEREAALLSKGRLLNFAQVMESVVQREEQRVCVKSDVGT